MNQIVNFKNPTLQKLYDISHSSEVANLKNTTDIKNVLLPLINDVINDTNAYFEAREWSEFSPVIQHVEMNNSMYIRMDYEESMCFSLFMYIYH
jgi:hypothetical protein